MREERIQDVCLIRVRNHVQACGGALAQRPFYPPVIVLVVVLGVGGGAGMLGVVVEERRVQVFWPVRHIIRLIAQGNQLILGVHHSVQQHQREPAEIGLEYTRRDLLVLAERGPELARLLLHVVVRVVLGSPKQKLDDELADVGVRQKVRLHLNEQAEALADFLADGGFRVLVQRQQPLEEGVEVVEERVGQRQHKLPDAVECVGAGLGGGGGEECDELGQHCVQHRVVCRLAQLMRVVLAQQLHRHQRALQMVRRVQQIHQAWQKFRPRTELGDANDGGDDLSGNALVGARGFSEHLEDGGLEEAHDSRRHRTVEGLDGILELDARHLPQFR
mmetsp:Transcript_56100/g.114683  ORF Transcript_56100/g.114683 Transcript_56100/m.114683 type:complete len:333 (+) Transcript_56100:906-1904(+)